MKKIDLYLNGRYICSSNRYKRCKDFIKKIKDDNFIIHWQGLTGYTLNVSGDNKLVARFSK